MWRVPSRSVAPSFARIGALSSHFGTSFRKNLAPDFGPLQGDPLDRPLTCAGGPRGGEDGREKEVTRTWPDNCSPRVPQGYPQRSCRAPQVSKTCQSYPEAEPGAQIWPEFDQVWPIWANVQTLPTLVEVGEFGAERGPHRPELATFGLNPGYRSNCCEQIWGSVTESVGQLRSSPGLSRVTFRDMRRASARQLSDNLILSARLGLSKAPAS